MSSVHVQGARPQPGRRAPRGLGALVAGLALLIAGAASADLYVGGGGGAMIPYRGATGWTAMLEMGTDWTNEHVRVGGELVFADLDQTVNLASVGGGVVDVGLRTYEARFVTRYVMFPDRITPYLGVGAGLIVIDLDDGVLAGVFAPGVTRTNGQIGFGGGVEAQLGIEIPLFSKNLNLFGEGRAKYMWEITSNLGPVAGPDDWSGISAIAGIRARY